MSHSTESSKQHPTLLEKEFFNHFFRLTLRPQELWKPLKDKFKYYKQQSYNVSKTSSQISYIKKFNSVCTYLPYVGNIRAEKIEIPLIQDTIEAIYNQFETFFADGGWRAVKNKSYKAHIQEYLLMKLYKTHLALKIQGGLDNFVLAFFYTLNYYKTCNYQIRLFNNFLLNTDLESFFIFILLRKQSRRVNRDLSIKSEHISKFVRVLKGQKSFPSLGSYASENEEMGEVKLLLIYPQIIQFINNNGIVLHEILIYSLMKCSDMTGNSLASLERCNIDWNQFFNLYFNCSDEATTKPYSQQFIKKVVKANLKMGDSLVKLGESNITFVQDKYQPKQQFYEQSFEWLIGVIQGLIAEKQTCNLKWRQTYQKLIKLYEQKITLGNKLIEQIFRSQEYSAIYRRYSRVNKSVGYGSSG